MRYTPFSLVRDINGYNGFGLSFSVDKYSVNLPATTDTTLTVPSRAERYIAIMSYEPGTTVWVANNATAATPAGATFAATDSELNPVARLVEAGDVLHFYAPLAVEVGVVFYAV